MLEPSLEKRKGKRKERKVNRRKRSLKLGQFWEQKCGRV